MKISVIIPVYNSERYLRKCVDSIIGQTFPEWQLILVDDGSKDNSLELCHQFEKADNRIKVYHQENSGPGVARNTGIEHADGEYVVFVDSDDYLDLDYFMSLQKRTEDVVFFDMQSVDEKDNPKGMDKMNIAVNISKDEFIRKQMTGRITWGGVRKAVKLELLRDHNIKYTQHKIGEEALYSFLILHYASSIGYIDKILYYRVLRNDSQSHLPVEDPWGDVAISLINELKGRGLYNSYANTLNAFLLSAAVRCANRTSLTCESMKEWIDVTKNNMMTKYVIDKSYPVDYGNMDNNLKLIGILLRIKHYFVIYCLLKLREKIK